MVVGSPILPRAGPVTSGRSLDLPGSRLYNEVPDWIVPEEACPALAASLTFAVTFWVDRDVLMFTERREPEGGGENEC